MEAPAQKLCWVLSPFQKQPWHINAYMQQGLNVAAVFKAQVGACERIENLEHFREMSSAVQLLPANPCMLYSSRAGGIKAQEDRDLLTEGKESEEECDNDAE